MPKSPQVVLNVGGMTCQGCVNAVTKLIKRLDPAADVAVDLANGKVEATTSVPAERIASTLSAGGYETRVS
jgi:copper chaperone